MKPIAVGYAPCYTVTSKTCLSIYYYVKGSFLFHFYKINFYVDPKTLLAIFADFLNSKLDKFYFKLLILNEQQQSPNIYQIKGLDY